MKNNIKFWYELKHHDDKELSRRMTEYWKVASTLRPILEGNKIYIDDTHFLISPENKDRTVKNKTEIDNSEIPSDNFTFKSNELEEDETVKLVNKLLEFQEGLKSYNKEFNIFGDDITDYDKDYILQHIVINMVDYLKFLNWRLGGNDGVFLPEWFDMNLKDVMIKDLHFRRVNLELEMELLQDKIQKIDREIKRYENNSN
jgi:hypothetical protein|nr:MAG TPA: hypothetical protein [Caudoviricetes sp.]